VILMVVLGVLTESEAFFSVDWNVIAILFGIWTVAIYFGKTGIPNYLAVFMLRLSRNDIGLFLALMGTLAGFISIFVDNVVVIIMLAPVIFNVTKRLGISAFPFLIFTGLCSNFMGTALLLGDLPPQMLHSVAGIEFNEFIWQMGRPSSFPILTATFIPTVAILYFFKFRKMYAHLSAESIGTIPYEGIKNRKFAVIVVAVFLLTILAMALRELTGLHLGFIAVSGMTLLVLITESFRTKLKSPGFEEIIDQIDMKTMLFYISLFVLVGGINKVGLIQMIADFATPIVQNNFIAGTSLLYWITAPIVGIVEHDAYILAFLNVIRDLSLSSGINPWPLYWAVLWAGTLGSNLTVAGAPALFVAQRISEKEDSCRIGAGQFFSYTVPFVIISLVICYLLMMVVWVLPLAG